MMLRCFCLARFKLVLAVILPVLSHPGLARPSVNPSATDCRPGACSSTSAHASKDAAGPLPDARSQIVKLADYSWGNGARAYTMSWHALLSINFPIACESSGFET